MTKIYNYAFNIVIVYIFLLSLFSISNLELTFTNNNVSNINEEKVVNSNLLVMNGYTESLEDESINEDNNSTNVEEKRDFKEELVSSIDTSYTVLANELVTISHYGHDCYGCSSGYTASGYYVGDGRIYYEDSEFGNVRIVAADSKYPLGTIIRLSYQDNQVITAIVLDRGSAIGDGKKFQIDLLEPSEAKANIQGVFSNSMLEVLRLGY